MSEGTAVRKLDQAMKKVNKLDGQLLRQEQRVDDKDQTLYHNRLESANKTRHLKSTIQVICLCHIKTIGNIYHHVKSTGNVLVTSTVEVIYHLESTVNISLSPQEYR